MIVTAGNDVILQHPMVAGTAAALAAGAAGVWYSVLYSGSQIVAPVTKTIQGEQCVALTFDDGPTPGFTDRVLDILKSHQAHGSFFLIGSQVREHSELVQRMIAEGHTVGNHTWDHHHHGVWHGDAYWQDQLQRTSEAIMEVTGRAPALFRAPMGFKTPPQARAARRQAMRYVAWRVRAWDTLNISPATICRIVTAQVRGEDIVTMHDGLEPARRRCSQESTVQALPQILKFLTTRGLTSISLEQGLNEPAYQAPR
jgi:peptidoglycan/xylan/chitin deacetylase (PgdA/CDA1 family)